MSMHDSSPWQKSFSFKTTPRFPEDFDGGNLRSGLLPRTDKAISKLRAHSGPIRWELMEPRILLTATSLPAGFVESIYLQQPDLLGQLTAMTFAPDGRLFVLEKKGNVKIVKNGAVNSTPFFSVEVDGISERGLDGIELDPQFSTNGFVYLYYTAPDSTNPNVIPNAAKNRLVRVTANPAKPDVALPNSMVVLLDGIASDSGYHNGGSLHFGPDGMLYLGTGEAGTRQYASDLSSLSGKILRLDVDHLKTSDGIVPADNPFVNTPGVRPEIWAYGFRNPFTSAFDPVTGKFFVNDVGGSLVEEINDVTASGGNYGWPAAEGTSNLPNLVSPQYQYPHLGSNGAGEVDSSITGGVFYHAAAYPAETRFPVAYNGAYFFADYSRHFIRVLDPGTDQATPFIDPSFNDVIDLDFGPDGALYALGYQWRILRYSFHQAIPKDLSVSVTATPQDGMAPLLVSFTATVPDISDPPSLQYLWSFDQAPNTPAGITAGPSVSHTYPQAGSYRARVTVFGGRVPVSAEVDIAVSAGSNSPPRVKVKAPKSYVGGGEVVFSMSAKDREDGRLPASVFASQIVFHHQGHTHPYIDWTVGADRGSFHIPDVLAENDPAQWYQINVIATDSGGLQSSTSVDVHPQVGKFVLKTNIAGLILKLDEASNIEPIALEAVVRSQRQVEAPLTQDLKGIHYQFVKWSDGGEAAHTINAPKGRKTFTADYMAFGPIEVGIARVGVMPVALVPGTKGPTVKLLISNMGAVNVEGAGQIALVASADGIADAGDIDLAVLGVKLRLRAHRSKVYKIRINPVPINVPAGTYHIVAVLRNLINIPDTDPSNNSVIVTDGVPIGLLTVDRVTAFHNDIKP